MDELKRITDRITVMRDGQYVDTLNTPEAEISEVIRLMAIKMFSDTLRCCIRFSS